MSPDLFSAAPPTVSEITNAIKNILEEEFFSISVEGEVSQPKVSRNGHLYFTLKDDGAQLPCVMWRSTRERMGFDLEHGQQLICTGDIQVYVPHGRYQMMVKKVEQAGIGALQQKFEQMKKRLESEGLFDRIHKKPLPKFPETIGVITSETSAAWHDIKLNIDQRFPLSVIKLYHSATQGVQSAPQLARGLHYFQKHPVDVIIIGRGGGSLEDMWPFNEESVARAIFESKIPVISAVGHETDFSISDFVADVRANTPTQAAILATPDINELRMDVEQMAAFAEQQVMQKFQRYEQKIKQLAQNYVLGRVRERIQMASAKVQSFTQKIERFSEHLPYKKSEISSLEQRIKSSINRQFNESEKKSEQMLHRLQINDPNLALKQGYARVWQNGEWVKKMETVQDENPVEIQWQDGKKQFQSK
jgi:exodeoxyribonuclease VII large subunit